MKEVGLTQNKVALVDDKDFEYLNQWKWHVLKDYLTYYAARNIRLANGKQTSIRMHRVILNVPKGMVTDHIDHNGLNNQKANLRICDASENNMNRKSQRNSSSKFKGVFWHKRNKKWSAQLTFKGETNYLGFFNSEKDASLAYDKKAIELFGEFANLNN